MKDDTRKMFVRLAIEIPVAIFCGVVVAGIFDPVFTDLVRPKETGTLLGLFTLLCLAGSIACLIVGRGAWFWYILLLLTWFASTYTIMLMLNALH